MYHYSVLPDYFIAWPILLQCVASYLCSTTLPSTATAPDYGGKMNLNNKQSIIKTVDISPVQKYCTDQST